MKTRAVRVVTLIAALTAGDACSRNESTPPADAGQSDGGSESLGGPAPPLPSLPLSAEVVTTRQVGIVEELAPYARASVIRGALQRDEGERIRFHTHTAIAAAGLDDAWMLVLARSGLWLVERATLAVRARLATDTDGDLAVSPDHRQVAFGRCPGGSKTCSLEVLAYPSLAPLFSLAVDHPRRIRFSPDGRRIAIASATQNSATIIDVATHAVTKRIAEPSDVNDVVFLPFGNTIAYGTNEDETVVYDLDADKDVWRGRPIGPDASRAQGRDQNAVAYDEATDTLFTGGNDDTVWTLHGLRNGTPRIRALLSVDNDVDDIELLPSGELLVGSDSGTLYLFALDHAGGPPATGFTPRARVGHPGVLSSWRAQLNPLGSDVAGVLAGHAFRWTPPPVPPSRPSSGCLPASRPAAPKTPSPVRAERFAYYALEDRWASSEGDDELVLVEVNPEYRVLRVPLHPADPLDVRPEVLGRVGPAEALVRLEGGPHVLVARGEATIRIWRIAPRAPLPRPTEVQAWSSFAGHVVEADGKRFAYVEGQRALEIDAQGERELPPRQGLETLVWDKASASWSACASRCRPL